jgi:hypothetical protein
MNLIGTKRYQRGSRFSEAWHGDNKAFARIALAAFADQIGGFNLSTTAMNQEI